MDESIKSGQLVLIEDTDIHEYAFNSANNKTLKANYRKDPVVTIKVTVKSGTLSYAIGEDDPDADSNVYAADEIFVCDIVNGVANLKIKGSNPCSFVAEL
jgi:hypothetical protein